MSIYIYIYMKTETRAAFKLRVEKAPPKKKTISCLWAHPSQSPRTSY